MKHPLFRFAGRALGAPAALLAASILLWAPPCAAFGQTPSDPAEAAFAYLQSHPGDFSLVAFTARADGSVDPAGPSISIRPEERIPLGSTFKIVVLSAYALEVAAGRLDPQEGLTLADWEDYYLPGTDGGAHAAALQARGIPTTPEGFAGDPSTRATLDDLAQAMMVFSDNAATDFLHHRIGDPALRSTITELGLRGQDPPLSLLGVFLSWSNHETGVLTETRLRHLRRLSPARYEAEVRRLEAAYQDPRWRRRELQFLARTLAGSDYGLQARAAEITFPRGTARDYAETMARALAGNLLPPAANAILRHHLDVPLPDDTIFRVLGQKGGALAGVLTGATYGIPSTGEMGGTNRVAVLFLHRIPEREWAPMLQTGAVLFFAFRLDRDADFARRVSTALTR